MIALSTLANASKSTTATTLSNSYMFTLQIPRQKKALYSGPYLNVLQQLLYLTRMTCFIALLLHLLLALELLFTLFPFLLKLLVQKNLESSVVNLLVRLRQQSSSLMRPKQKKFKQRLTRLTKTRKKSPNKKKFLKKQKLSTPIVLKNKRLSSSLSLSLQQSTAKRSLTTILLKLKTLRKTKMLTSTLTLCTLWATVVPGTINSMLWIG